MTHLILVGRSSSHFTRVARMFALELGLPHTFRPVPDITSMNTADYADNPSLKVPTLVDERGPLFGIDNICAELTRRSNLGTRVVLRGSSSERAIANCEELILHVMTSEVSLILAKMSGAAEVVSPKVARGMDNSLRYLDRTLDAALAALPAERLFSFLEVALFCLIAHLPFRAEMSIVSSPRLAAFARAFARRDSARMTEYRFDVP